MALGTYAKFINMLIRNQLVKEVMAQMIEQRRIYNRDDVFDAVASQFSDIFTLSDDCTDKELFSYENNVSALNDAISKRMSKMKLDNLKKNQGQLLLGCDLEGCEYIQHYYHVDLIDGPSCVPVEKSEEYMLIDIIKRAEITAKGYDRFIKEHKILYKQRFNENYEDGLKKHNANYRRD